MANCKSKKALPYPEAVVYLESLSASEAAVHPLVVRELEQGFIQYWRYGDDVKFRSITEDTLPLAGLRPDNDRLSFMLAVVSGEFGSKLPELASDLASGTLGLGIIELSLWEISLDGGAAIVKLLLEQYYKSLPVPKCERCGRCYVNKAKSFQGCLGLVTVERSYFHCQSCSDGCFPLDKVLGMRGSTFTPGIANIMSETATVMSFDNASRHLKNVTGVAISSSSLQRWPQRLDEEAQWFEKEEVIEDKPTETLMYLSIDETSFPTRKEETQGIRGKQEDGGLKSREEKLAIVYTAEDRAPKTGAVRKDKGSETVTCLIDSVAAPSESVKLSDFIKRSDREARRRGLYDAKKPGVVTDGAEWIRNTCEELFGVMTITFVWDVFHALECASKAVNAIYRGKKQRKRLFEEFKASILAGAAARVIWELNPLREQFKEAEECCRYFSNALDRMHCDQYRNDGLQIGSDVVGSGRKQVGSRLKQTGARWLKKAANAMLTMKTVVLNQRLTDFLYRRANQYSGVAA